MASRSVLLRATAADGAWLWACIDPTVHHCAAKLAATRLGARLAPFPDRDAALAAFHDVGATIEGEKA